jgi:hypothetical protein
MTGWLENWKGFGRTWSRQIHRNTRAIAWRDCRKHKTRTATLSNTSRTPVYSIGGMHVTSSETRSCQMGWPKRINGGKETLLLTSWTKKIKLHLSTVYLTRISVALTIWH